MLSKDKNVKFTKGVTLRVQIRLSFKIFDDLRFRLGSRLLHYKGYGSGSMKGSG